MTTAKTPLRVSDHAVLRWLERNAFVDVESVRAEILRQTRPALTSGATAVKVNGVEYRIQNGTVTTAIVKRSDPRPLKWPAKE